MDTVLIKQTSNYKSLIKASMIKYEILTLKNRKTINRFLIITILILTSGFLIGVMGSESAEFIILLGFLLLIIVSNLIMKRIHLKKRYMQNVKQEIIELEKDGIDYNWQFSDFAVKYWDNKKSFELKWTAFKGYSIYKEHIILLLNDSNASFYVFGKTDNDDNDFEKIIEFAKMKLPFKEIK